MSKKYHTLYNFDTRIKTRKSLIYSNIQTQKRKKVIKMIFENVKIVSYRPAFYRFYATCIYKLKPKINIGKPKKSYFSYIS